MKGFFALMSQLNSTKRWSQLPALESESVAEHTLQVIMFSHVLALMQHEWDGQETLSINKVLLYAMYHDALESITGDASGIIKAKSPVFKDATLVMEEVASTLLIGSLMPQHKQSIGLYLNQAGDEPEQRLVKAADRLSSLAKAKKEFVLAGNQSFKEAVEFCTVEVEKYVKEFPVIKIFMQDYLTAFEKSFDYNISNSKHSGHLP